MRNLIKQIIRPYLTRKIFLHFTLYSLVIFLLLGCNFFVLLGLTINSLVNPQKDSSEPAPPSSTTENRIESILYPSGDSLREVVSGNPTPGFPSPRLEPARAVTEDRVTYQFTTVNPSEFSTINRVPGENITSLIPLPPGQFSINEATGQITVDSSYRGSAGDILWVGVEATGSSVFINSVKAVVGYQFLANGTTFSGDGSTAQFNNPSGIAVDGSGNVYVGDTGNNRIRKITPAGVVTTLPGNFNSPKGVALHGQPENVFVANSGADRIYQITSGGVVKEYSVTRYNDPFGVVLDGGGSLYFTLMNSHRITKIVRAAQTVNLAGDGTAGFADGRGANARFNFPRGVAIDWSENLYVADMGNNSIRKITPAGSVGEVTTLAGDGTAGFVNGSGANARFSSPVGVAVDGEGNVYVADTGNNSIRKITPGGKVTTLAGDGTAGFADGSGANARFSSPTGVAVDGEGNVYVADTGNNRIRKITQ